MESNLLQNVTLVVLRQQHRLADLVSRPSPAEDTVRGHVERSSGRPGPAQPLFPSRAGGFWRETDWRNWRKRVCAPVAEAVGLAGARPYDLRHAFASLLIHEGRLSVVEIAAQLGHNPTVCLDTYGHVMAEQRGAEHVSAEEQILAARTPAGPSAAAQLSFDGIEA